MAGCQTHRERFDGIVPGSYGLQKNNLLSYRSVGRQTSKEQKRYRTKAEICLGSFLQRCLVKFWWSLLKAALH